MGKLTGKFFSLSVANSPKTKTHRERTEEEKQRKEGKVKE
jgi:hypothetical protein